MTALSPQRLTMLIFFLQPIAFGSWLPRIPEVQQGLGLGPAALAIALLGLPCGTLLTLPFAGPLVGRIGARQAILVGMILYSLAVCLPALAPGSMLLFAALMLAGSSLSFVELGLNVHADAVEKATGAVIMTTSHGFWSVGIMAGSLLGSGLAALHVPPGWAIAAVSLAVLPLALLVARALPAYRAGPARGERRPGFALPSWALLGVCFFVFGITMTEGAMADWSAIFLRDALGAEGGMVGLGYAVFAMMVAAGRFGGDSLKRWFGAVATARICGVLALVGALTLFVAPNEAIALCGFAVIGLGVSVGFPLSVTAAASIDDRPAASNVAVLSFVALLGFLVGPPLIGLVAEYLDMRMALLCLVPVLLLSLLLSGRLAAGARNQSLQSQLPLPGVP